MEGGTRRERGRGRVGGERVRSEQVWMGGPCAGWHGGWLQCRGRGRAHRGGQGRAREGKGGPGRAGGARRQRERGGGGAQGENAGQRGTTPRRKRGRDGRVPGGGRAELDPGRGKRVGKGGGG